ncbi:non-ribosomal peptide synthetase [Chryseobacterium aureum]|uniref:non-ribosomal peptide synthetase n=1 Tax=Chryseobacterium aureum TaxID=2497456 RepID=UPI000F881F25|nr:non-ribosomal peptide synthetase [Chryseobacterium aureum]
MEVFEILEKAKTLGISVKLKEGGLVIKSENKKIDADFLGVLKNNKADIVDYLNRYKKRNRPSLTASYEKIKGYDRNLHEHIPLSFGQERLWFLDRLYGSVEYHIPFALRLSGDLDKKALYLSLKETVNRHEILRTVIYSEEGVGYQKVLPPGDWELSFKEMAKDPVVLKEELKSFLSVPFDLSSDYMFRSCLYDLGGNEYVLAGVFHHISSDGWSQNILIRDFIQLYRSYVSGRETGLLPLSLQYADYAMWQREYIEGEVIDRQLSYWECQLEGVSVLELPKDYARPAGRTVSGDTLSFTLDSALSTDINSLSREEGVTVFMTLLAAFKVLLNRYSGQEDICVGTSVANRTQKELENMIGFFVNTLPLRTQVKEEASFRELLHAVKQTTLDAYDHQQVPFEKIVNRVVKTRDTRVNPIFQVMFLLQNVLDSENTEIKEIEGLTLSGYGERQLHTAQFDLTLTVSETAQGFHVGINYCTDLFKAETIQRMFADYQELLKSIVAAPSSQTANLSMLTGEEEHRLLKEFNDTAVDYPKDKTVVDLFEAQVAQNPDAVALVCDGESLTYGELDEKSNQLAYYLRIQCGVVPEDIVGILLDRSIWSVISIIGILKSGACYLPIDKTYPSVRKKFIIEDAKAKLLITDSESVSDVSDYEIPVLAIDTQFESLEKGTAKTEYKPSPENLAYIIYTSGSTGKPKGVMVEHKNLTNYLLHSIDSYRTNDDRYSFPLFSSLSFDLTQTSIYLTLLTGGALYIYKDHNVGDVFAEVVSNEAINSIKLTPAHLSFFRELDNSNIQCYIIGGEQLTHSDLKNLGTLHPSARLFNEYGPTEATIGCVVSEITHYGSMENITIGHPISNTQIYILNPHGNLVTIGSVGELCIGGAQVTRGYLNREELTHEKFISNPFRAGERLYKTGDLAKWLPDGSIEFLGRKDDQVKVNGYRIELGEIENILSGLPGVRQSCVVAREDEYGDRRLVAYAVVKGDWDKETLQSQLQETLPEYMVPRLWVKLDEMPLTINGKLDRKALPDIDSATLATKTYVAPRTEIEERLAEIWQNLLGVEKVGIYDNFFELGGQSLLSIRLIARIRKLGYTVNIGEFYTDPTIAHLTTKLTSTEEGYKVPENGIVKGTGYITPSMVTLVDLSQKELDIIMDHVPGGAPNIQDIYPLSPLQEGIYFHHLMSDRNTGDPYVLPILLSFPSLEKRSEFMEAIRFVINRHDVLRTCVVNEGLSKTVQVVLQEAELNVEELVTDKTQEILPQVQQLVEHKNLWIDLSKAPILEVKVANDAANDSYYAVIYYHHLMTDRIGRVKMIEEIELYLSGRADLLPTPALYRDFIGHTLNKEKLNTSKTYFSELFQNIESPTYPFNLSSNKMDGSINVVSSKTMLSPELGDGIIKLSKDLQMSPAVVFHAAFGLVVGRCSGSAYALFGSVLMGRLQGSGSSESSLGLFLNTLPLLLDLKGDIPSYINQTKSRLQSLLDHEHTPLSNIHNWSGIPNDIPMFSALFNYRHQAKDKSAQSLDTLLDTGVKSLLATERTNYPVNLAVEDYGNTFGLTFDISSAVGIDPSAVAFYMEEALQTLLMHMDNSSQTTVEELSILTKEETHQLVEVFNDTEVDYPKDRTIVDLFEEQVTKSPETVAVVYEDKQMTYRELDEKSNQLAHYLVDKGVSVEDLVGISVERSLEMIVGILGILKAGAAYVPIDPDYPESRISYMLEDSKIKVLLSSENCTGIFTNTANLDIILLDTEWNSRIGKHEVSRLQRKSSPDNLAYIIYTSGSTGRPKGVMIEHRNISNFLYCQKDFYQVTTEDQFLLFFSFSFDPSVEQIFVPLLNGAVLHVVPKEKLLNVEKVVQLLVEKKITHLHAVPSFLRELPYVEGNCLKRIISGGDVFDREIYKKWGDKGIRIINEFGPTETTITSSEHELKEDTMPSDIGRPVANTQMYILGPDGKLLPMGAVGELFISGFGVARGYLNNEELTKDRFTSNPFRKGERMYKTGDLARWLPGGNIEFLGRKDNQVKIRGYRIELGEIENVLSGLPGVTQSCVLAKQDSEGKSRLVAYVVKDNAPDKELLQSQLEEILPEYMVPRLWVELDEMPLTSNGKLDRKALPDIDSSALSTKAYIAPRTETEERLAVIWQELLGVEKVGIHDNFFELGGHSLLATRLVSMIRKELDVEVTIRDVFVHTTIGNLGSHLQKQEKGIFLPEIIKVEERPARIPLSFSQERLWFLDRLQGSVEYHIPFALRLSGDLDREALFLSLKEIVNRHEVLRTVIHSDEGVGYQEVLAADDWGLSYQDIAADVSVLPGDLQAFLSAPFDLSRDYMFRSCLYDLGGNEYVLAGVFHHISSDGWSQGILIGEFVELYHSYVSGKESGLMPLSLQYVDYALWQRNNLEGAVLDRQLSYWEDQLKDVKVLELPTDYRRPALQSFSGASLSFELDGSLSAGISSLSREEGVTVFMTLLGAFKVLLSRYSGQEDICVGTPVANRTRKELEGMIGFFVNTLALRSQVAGEKSFRDFLQDIRHTTLEAYDHQQVPFEKVVERVARTRDMSVTPLFQVMFVLQNTPDSVEIELDGLSLRNYESQEQQTSKFDLTITIEESASGFSVNMNYCKDLFREETIRSMFIHYQELLQSIVASPATLVGELSLLTVEEKHQLLEAFNDTAADYPEDKTVIDLFEEQAATTPDATAAVYEGRSLTYRELDERSNQLARILIAKGVSAEDLVGISMNRSVEMIIGILGILKSGGAYVPIDPDYPQARKEYMLEDSGIKLLLSDNGFAYDRNPVDIIVLTDDWSGFDDISGDKIERAASASNLAYVIYTSGSTGKPKGVAIAHSSLSNFLLGMVDRLEMENMKTFLSVTTYTFDIFYLELFTPLILGAKVIILDKLSIRDGHKLQKAIEIYTPDFMQATPSTWQMLIDSSWENKEKVTVLTGGEAINESLKNSLTAISTTVWNLYGPTEAAIWATAQKLKGSEKVNIGKAISNISLYILDKNDTVLPVGVAGELCIGGSGVARGYLNNEELTNERFIANPFKAGERIYKTGDLARWMADGNIEFIGRIDNQVKIRGHRIELGEIEDVLSGLPEVTQSCVLARADEHGDKKLVAYVVLAGDLDKEALQSQLQETLPEYMVPRLWMKLDEMPLTSNGKLDRKALPEIEASLLSANDYVAPTTETEEKLARIWQELLGIEKVGIHDNFFELGGHSLLAFKIITHINKVFDTDIRMALLFEFPTIFQLAANMNAKSLFDNDILIPLQKSGNKKILFLTPDGSGTCHVYGGLTESLGNDQPVYGFHSPGLNDESKLAESLEEMVTLFVNEMQKVDPHGPYRLGGYSFGAIIAYQMALQLKEKGFEVEELLIFDGQPESELHGETEEEGKVFKRLLKTLIDFFRDSKGIGFNFDFDKENFNPDDLFIEGSVDEQIDHVCEKLRPHNEKEFKGRLKVRFNNYKFSRSYKPADKKKLNTGISLFKAIYKSEKINGESVMADHVGSNYDWDQYTHKEVIVHPISADHHNILTLKDNVKQIAGILKDQ